MKRSLALACALALIIPSWRAHAEIPALTIRTGDGRALELDRFRGKPVLVDFWASWCAPCLPGLKSLEAIKRDYADADLAIVPISLDRGGPVAAVRGYAKADITRLPLYLADPDDATARFALGALPTTILFDALGREHARFDGAAQAREKAIRRALATLTPSTPRRGARP